MSAEAKCVACADGRECADHPDFVTPTPSPDCCDDRRRPCVYHDTYSDGIEAALYVIDRAGEVPRG